MIKIEPDIVAALLAKVASGELPAATSHDGSCTWTICADGFVIEIFDDAHKVDYVERVTDAAGTDGGVQRIYEHLRLRSY